MISNWYELSLFVKNEKNRRGSIINMTPPPLKSVDQDLLNPPKEEEELVQLNVALQKEIVKFTANGIRQALKAMEVTGLHRSSSGRTSTSGAFVIFVSQVAQCL
ncbi:hypothetical protein EON65_34730 [archaeon]|nr:MAG: hypothetical protein EON65_34730 [archaeon]